MCKNEFNNIKYITKQILSSNITLNHNTNEKTRFYTKTMSTN